jgi:TatD DNase family protein
MFVDSHCHIDVDVYDADRVEVLERAYAAGIEAVLVIGTGDPHRRETERAFEIVESYTNDKSAAQPLPRMYATIGVHPHDAHSFDDAIAARFEALFNEHASLVALGEIGLDYHYDNSPRDVQRKVFVQQLRLARKLNLPVVIHTREAEDDTMAVLEAEMSDYARVGGSGVMHCFGGTAKMAERALQLNFMISFAGNLTFRKAEELREVAKTLPLERLLIETDAPYLSPVPYRGKRNEPAHVKHVAATLAALHETTIETIGLQTTANFTKLYQLASGARI